MVTVKWRGFIEDLPLFIFRMPNKCSVVNCNGNYNIANKCRVFRLPKDQSERQSQSWINQIPPRENYTIQQDKYFICERHWPVDVPMVKIPGGLTVPACAPSIFRGVPASCLPTPKPKPREPQPEDRQLVYLQKKDRITPFIDFSPEKQLMKKYQNVMSTRLEDKLVCVFMKADYTES